MAGYYEIKKAKDGQFHFNLKAGNHEIILSSELYKTKAACENGISSVQKNSADEARFERRNASNGKPYFILKAANGQEIGRSEMYESEAARDNGIASVQKNGPSTDVKDKSEDSAAAA
ncbi:MAG: YegP family protein [Alphaproteobacteria bacterium]|nr:YegP family protein [Alphaproteobacteria bacterium]MCB9974020.1 YegP family protein [Rhodospirillales bacterium]